MKLEEEGNQFEILNAAAYFELTSVLCVLLFMRCFRMMSLSAKPPAIDWAYYKQNIAMPGMVESFQKQVCLLLNMDSLVFTESTCVISVV